MALLAAAACEAPGAAEPGAATTRPAQGSDGNEPARSPTTASTIEVSVAVTRPELDAPPALPAVPDDEAGECAFEGASDFSRWATVDLAAEVEQLGDQIGLIVVNTTTGDRGVGGCVSRPLLDTGLTAVLVSPHDGGARLLVWAPGGRQPPSFDWIADSRDVRSDDGFAISVHTVTTLENASPATPSEAQIVGLVAQALQSDVTTVALVTSEVLDQA